MSAFTSFRNCLVELGGTQIFATSANLSIETSLQRDVRIESYSEDTAGALINNPRLVPTAGVKGTLNFDFVIADEHFNVNPIDGKNSIHKIFELNRGMSPELEKVGRIGNYRFFNAGIRSLSFEMRPFSLIKARAEYEIFGSVVEVQAKSLPVQSGCYVNGVLDDSHQSETACNAAGGVWRYGINPAEGLKSFGTVTANGINLATQENYDIQLISANYSIVAKRKYNYSIRANEHPINQFVPGAMMPYRVSLSEVEVNCNISSNKIIPNMNESGYLQNSFESLNLRELEVQLSLFEARNFSTGSESNNLANFSCIGNVTSQNLEVSDGSYLVGSFNVMQVLK